MPLEEPRVSARRFDLSRDTFDPEKHYRSVVSLQGRVSVEADENEQRRIDLHRDDTTTQDVIGWAGYPKGTTGFAIAASGSDLTIAAGRMYVDGILCECDGTTLLTQPDLPLVDATATATLANLPSFSGAGTYAVSLDVWERDVTVLEDPEIRERALGGPDHAARTKTMWQVELTKVATGTTCATVPVPTVVRDGTLTARTDASAATRDCVLPPTAGFQSKENQLYRVEIHDPGATGTATFKWSRENASVVAAVDAGAGTLGQTFTAQGLSPDSTLAFIDNAWVEFFDDVIDAAGGHGVLAQIKHVDVPTRTVTLYSPLTGTVYLDRNPRMRRWDFDPAAGGPIATAATWTTLEFGVQVEFGGTFQTGDYWLIPARTAIDETTGSLDYPSTPQPASYVAHSIASLAVVTYSGTSFDPTVLDCRLDFPPLTAITATDVSFTPHCPSLAGATNVQEAIDLLCDQRSGVCDVIVAPGATWDAALRALDSTATPSVEICFAAGSYTMQIPIVLKGFTSVKMTGAGLGTAVTSAAEVGFAFTTCTAVTVRDIAVTTQRVGEGPPSPDYHIGGPLTCLNVGDLTVENVTLACADGPHREAACLAVENDVGTNTSTGTGSVRIRGSRMHPGMMQIGILVSHVERVTIEDNELSVNGSNIAIDTAAFMKDAIYAKRVARLFYGQMAYAKTKPATAQLLGETKLLDEKAVAQPDAAATERATMTQRSAMRTPASGGMSQRHFTLEQGKTLVYFGAAPSMKPVFDEIVAKAKPTSAAQTVKIVRSTALQFVTDKNLRAQYGPIDAYFNAANADNPRTGARGISIGGRGFSEVRILNNTIAGFLQGITVGTSHYRPKPRGVGDLDIGGSLTIRGNAILVRVPSTSTLQAKHAIYVGNVMEVSIVENQLRLAQSKFANVNAGQVRWALKLFGVHGPYLSVRSNRFEGFPIALYAYHLRTPAMPLPSLDTAFWEVIDNFVHPETASKTASFVEGPGGPRIFYSGNKVQSTHIINSPL